MNEYIKGFIGGVLGVFAMGVIMVAAYLFGLSGLDILKLIETTIVPSGLRGTVIGMSVSIIFKLVIGGLLGVPFAKIARSGTGVLRGGMYGYILWVVLFVFLFPQLNILPVPWFLGTGTAVISIIGFLTYGGIIGYFFSNLSKGDNE